MRVFATALANVPLEIGRVLPEVVPEAGQMAQISRAPSLRRRTGETCDTPKVILQQVHTTILRGVRKRGLQFCTARHPNPTPDG